MKIWAYAICWNEIKMLPYYFRHYETFCEKIIIYDNGSNDGSQEFVKNHPKGVLRTYDTQGQIRDDVYIKIKNNCWKEACGKADYVIVGDIDEFIYHPNIFKFLEEHLQFSIFKPAGWNMVSNKFPTTSGQIYSEVKTGAHHGGQSKPILFDPKRVKEIAFAPGCHGLNQKKLSHEGKFWWFRQQQYNENTSPLKMLHFKFMGMNYVYGRYQLMARRLSAVNRKHGWGFHYKKPRQWVQKEFDKWKKNSRKII
jgi:hypothetical protein